MQFGSFDEIREVRKYIRYIDPSRHNFEKCLLPCFVPQSGLSSQKKTWKETIFKIMAGKINVSISSMEIILYTYFYLL